MEEIYIGCDHDLEYTRARAGGSYLNSGTVTYTITTEAGAAVTSGTLSYVAGSNGKYAGVVDGDDLASLTENAVYIRTITYTDADDGDDKRVTRLVAKYRT